MRGTLLTALTCLSWTWLACHAATAPSDARCGKFVATGTRALTVNEMSPGDRDVFMKRSPGGQPGCVEVDFNADGLNDVALIVQDRSSGVVSLMVALAKKGGGFTTALQKPLGSSLDGLFLAAHSATSVEPTEAVDSTEKSRKLRGGAVDLVFVEKATVVYYWNDVAGKIAELQSGD
jgi:hypothetical protein